MNLAPTYRIAFLMLCLLFQGAVTATHVHSLSDTKSAQWANEEWGDGKQANETGCEIANTCGTELEASDDGCHWCGHSAGALLSSSTTIALFLQRPTQNCLEQQAPTARHLFRATARGPPRS